MSYRDWFAAFLRQPASERAGFALFLILIGTLPLIACLGGK